MNAFAYSVENSSEDFFNSIFSGRDEELKILENRIMNFDEPVVIVGRRGVGKTAFLHFFSKKFEKLFDGGILRFSSSRDLKFETIQKQLKDYLKKGKTLLIIDDAEYLESDIITNLLSLKLKNLKLLISTRSTSQSILHKPNFPYYTIALQPPSAIDIIKKRVEYIKDTITQSELTQYIQKYLNEVENSNKTPREIIQDLNDAFNQITAKESYVDEENINISENSVSIRIDYISLFFSLLLFILSQISSNVSETKIIDTIQSVKQELHTIVELNESSISKRFVNRAVNMRDEPILKSKVIDVLPKNLIVTVIKSENQWIYIKYIDYSTAEEKYGWVYEKYLSKMPNH